MLENNSSSNNEKPDEVKPATINFSPDTHKSSEEKPVNIEIRKKD